ncbi:MAG: DUF2608 domain-containing protein [Simkaniaceae bacterium]|nr:DUF2608 domain-containing protein [Simkaniaceae bacterium]
MRYYILIFCLSLSMGFSQIIPVNSAAEVEKYVTEGTLVVFDIDYVLVRPVDKAFHMGNIIKHRSVVKSYHSHLSPMAKDMGASFLVSGELELMESELPTLIERLEKGGATSVALTAVKSDTPWSQKGWRYEQLKKLGIDFSKPFELKSKVFEEVDHEVKPVFDRGILMSNGQRTGPNKGLVLKAFIEEVGLEPKRIVFIDDNKDNLIAMEQAFSDFELYCLFDLYPYKRQVEEISTEEMELKWKQLIVDVERGLEGSQF